MQEQSTVQSQGHLAADRERRLRGHLDIEEALIAGADVVVLTRATSVVRA